MENGDNGTMEAKGYRTMGAEGNYRVGKSNL